MGPPDRAALSALLCPQTNPNEQVWWTLHETLTWNHRCARLAELLDVVYEWIEACQSFYGPELCHYATAA